MQQTGTVLKTENGIATVEVMRMSACEGCHKSAEGCAACAVVGGQKKHTLYAKNSINAKEGDKVELSAPTGRVLFYAFAVFVLPIISALAFYFVSAIFFEGGYPFLFAFFGVALVFAVLALLNVRAEKNVDTEIIRIVNNMGGNE